MILSPMRMKIQSLILLRWSYEKNEKDTSLEKSIIKTIAGFLITLGKVMPLV